MFTQFSSYIDKNLNFLNLFLFDYLYFPSTCLLVYMSTPVSPHLRNWISLNLF